MQYSIRFLSFALGYEFIWPFTRNNKRLPNINMQSVQTTRYARGLAADERR
jgi:hypothetical protein